MIDAYYDSLAPYYKYIYADWEASVQLQAAALDSVIREFIGPDTRRILDAACGIGTQSIGLAQLGYMVTASDLSSQEVEQARAEASKRGLNIEFRVADMRAVYSIYQQQFDVVMACDNAIPHLLSAADISLAFQQFYACTRLGGGCIITVRDYAGMERAGRQLNPRQVHATANGRLVIFDVWDFDGDFYDMATYVVEDTGGNTAQMRILRGRYYCVTIAVLERLMAAVGFQQVRTLRDRFFQPLIIGRKE